MNERDSIPIYATNKFAIGLFGTSSVIFLLTNITYFCIYFSLISLVMIGLILYDNYNQNKKKMPFRVTVILITFICWLFMFDYRMIIMVFLFMVAIYILKNPSVFKKYKLLIPLSIVLFLITLINISRLPSAFVLDRDSEEMEFTKMDKRLEDNYIPYDGFDTESQTFRSLTYLGLRTDMNDDLITFNFDQANISIDIWVNTTTITSNLPFWNTTIRAYLVWYEGWVKDAVVDEDLMGYPLLDRIQTYEDFVEHYEDDYADNRVHLELNNVHMGTYLIAIDCLLTPCDSNKYLYEDFELTSILAPLFFSANSTLNYGIEVSSRGYVYAMDYLSPKTQADNLFDDLIGQDIWNLMLLYIIIFCIAVFVAMIARNFQIVKTINIILMLIFIIALFCVIATGMDNVPQWLVIIMQLKNAMYLWGIIEAVKYFLSMGTVMGIILLLTGYLESHYEAILGFLKYGGG